ncbi:MAG: hypothetical protein IH802_08590, partial [Nitrospinae bacterium]|nr:hypothetical protein [Nitrospinota bacterium]
SELEYHNGAVARLGKEAGVDTPVNTFIYYALLSQEMAARATTRGSRRRGSVMASASS